MAENIDSELMRALLSFSALNQEGRRQFVQQMNKLMLASHQRQSRMIEAWKHSADAVSADEGVAGRTKAICFERGGAATKKT
ncbi:hypothetical protein [Burkholderia diffusa]|uniref:hypothetical protein n=1 Tax=Burkholderia diffusa TaxID=488732 RepID=UPI000B230009|nr:hypothetical protein [Burkholderia diffusa]